MRSNVVLPHPDGPSSTRNSPSRIERSTSSTAWSCPNRLLRCRISTPAIDFGRSPVAAVVFATADLAADALAAARGAGVAMLRVVDGRTAFDTSGWSTPGHYPAWLPAYLPQLVDRDISGQPRARLLEAGRPDMILDCFQIEKERRHG